MRAGIAEMEVEVSKAAGRDRTAERVDSEVLAADARALPTGNSDKKPMEDGRMPRCSEALSHSPQQRRLATRSSGNRLRLRAGRLRTMAQGARVV